MDITWSDLLATLWEPWYLMLVTLTFVPQTLGRVVVAHRPGRLATLTSWRAFQDAWFADVWAVLGPQFAAGSAPVVRDLLARARGVVLDIGPGAGNWVHLYPNPKGEDGGGTGGGRGEGGEGAGAVTKIYGVEPNGQQHASLRRKVREAGLEGVYEIVGAGAEELGGLGLGIGHGTVDTVVTKQVLCSVPAPERLVRELYGYLRPGGVWIMYEHVKTKERGWVRWYQGMFSCLPPLSLSFSLSVRVELMKICPLCRFCQSILAVLLWWVLAGEEYGRDDQAGGGVGGGQDQTVRGPEPLHAHSWHVGVLCQEIVVSLVDFAARGRRMLTSIVSLVYAPARPGHHFLDWYPS